MGTRLVGRTGLAPLLLLAAACTAPAGRQAAPSTFPAPVVAPLAGSTTSSSLAAATVTSPAPLVATTLPTSTAASAVEPDAAFTPGETNPVVTQATIGRTICVSGWTATVRPPESYTEQIKHLEDGAGGVVTYQGVSYSVHGFELADHNISDFELDHLVPLEIGGSPADPRNLWLEPYEAPKGPAAPGTGSQTKDKVENAARVAVCAGRLTLADAQREMAANWSALGIQLGAIG